MAYICTIKARPKEINIEKCIENDVPPGQKIFDLSQNRDVTLADGRVIKAADVYDEPDKDAIFFGKSYHFQDKFTSIEIHFFLFSFS